MLDSEELRFCFNVMVHASLFVFAIISDATNERTNDRLSSILHYAEVRLSLVDDWWLLQALLFCPVCVQSFLNSARIHIFHLLQTTHSSLVPEFTHSSRLLLSVHSPKVIRIITLSHFQKVRATIRCSFSPSWHAFTISRTKAGKRHPVQTMMTTGTAHTTSRHVFVKMDTTTRRDAAACSASSISYGSTLVIYA